MRWLVVGMVVLMLFDCVLCGFCDFVCMRFVWLSWFLSGQLVLRLVLVV